MGPSGNDIAEDKGRFAEAASKLPKNAALTLDHNHDLIIKRSKDGEALKDEDLEQFLDQYLTGVDEWLAAMARARNATARAIAS